jgi:RNA polymerase-binding protein DksA
MKEEQYEKLNKEVLNKIKSDLQERKKQLEEDLEDIAQKGEDGDEYRARFPEFGDKPDENAQEISEYTTNIATEEVLNKTLRDINNALERIEKGTYGSCKYCGRTINEKRLMARPTASACIECKTKLQQEQ